MTPRFRFALVFIGALAIAGCSDTSGPLRYARNDRLAQEKNVKPQARAKAYEIVDKLFGESPLQMTVPPGTGLAGGGIHLAGRVKDEAGKVSPVQFIDPDSKMPVAQEGGYALYRLHCLHCHGVSGDGNGPTADFLFPRPRDYRKGIYKFTSTATGQKPARGDLYRTISQGLPGTSMPSFDALMSKVQIEQVIDYMTFLSMRGEVEERLLTEASNISVPDKAMSDAERKQLDEELKGLEETGTEIAQGVFTSWKTAESMVFDPPAARFPKPATTEAMEKSVKHGREIFLGRTSHKAECAGCHGSQAVGNGKSFVDQSIFWENFYPEKRAVLYEQFDELSVLDQIAGEKAFSRAKLPETILSSNPDLVNVEVAPLLKSLEGKKYVRGDGDALTSTIDKDELDRLRKLREAWRTSLDDWGRPIRPANLNLGQYKGGRRPLDIYLRLAKGINGAKMPAHANSMKPDEIWDVVNFVLALPYDPELLRGAKAADLPPAASPKVASQ